MKPAVGIIGGTGIHHEEIFTDVEEITVQTRYGSVPLKSAKYKDERLIFLERHGKNHILAPHEINYRANIAALKELGVERIIATAAVGAINPEYKVGSFALIHDFIDFTKQRKSTFFEDTTEGIVHIDLSEPYCPELRNSILQVGKSKGLKIHDKGTYICTEGPRFETKGEIKAFSFMGADLVGMTNVPEVILAREMGICYAAIAMITNYAAGISRNALTHKEVIENMQQMSDNLRGLLLAAIDELPPSRECECKYSIRELGSLK